MKIGVLSDIHGNLDALIPVLDDATSNGVTKLWVLGDIVGYYYQPQEVLKALNHWDFEFISGNHEDLLLRSLSDDAFRAEVKKKYGSGIEKAIEQLSEKEIEFLTQAPSTKRIEIKELSALLCHGSPWDRDFYIYPDSPSQIIQKCKDTKNDIVLIGHSHYPFIIENDGFSLINPGSVGQSRQEGGIANWALLDFDNNKYEVRSCRYDTKNLANECESIDPENEYLKNILSRKKK